MWPLVFVLFLSLRLTE